VVEAAGWGTLWPMIQSDVTFGRALLEDISYGQIDRASFTDGLSDSQLGDLFIWLLEQYPPDNKMVSGAMGANDAIRFLRDRILEQLKRRSTFEACDAVARAELHLPQHRWLRRSFSPPERLQSTDEIRRFSSMPSCLLERVPNGRSSPHQR
jgi:hypothetical protein